MREGEHIAAGLGTIFEEASDERGDGVLALLEEGEAAMLLIGG
jgi:hypothetical protein